MVGRLRLTQGNRHALDVRVGLHCQRRNRLVVLDVQRAVFHVALRFRLQTQRLLEVLFVGDNGVNVLDQLGHDFLGILAVLPEVLAVVQVAGHMDALRLRRLHRFQRQIRRALRDGRRDAGQVEPRRTLKRLVPVDVAGLGFRDGRTRAVIDDFGGTLHSASFQIVDAHAAVLADNLSGINAEAAQFADAGIADIVGGQHGHERGFHAVVRQRNRHVRLAAAEGRFKGGRLEQALIRRGLEAKHDFAERYNLSHWIFPPIFILRNFCL